MEEMRLIEPDHLASPRVPGDGLTDLARPQTVSAFPLEFDSGSQTERLNFRSACGLKHVLPGEVQSAAVVANIEDFLPHEPLANSRVDARENVPAVGYRRLPTRFGGIHAMKPNLHRPGARIRHLVVQRNELICGV